MKTRARCSGDPATETAFFETIESGGAPCKPHEQAPEKESGEFCYLLKLRLNSLGKVL